MSAKTLSPGTTPRADRCLRLPLARLCLLSLSLGTLSLSGCRKAPVVATNVHRGQQLDFNQDVQPILASNCFSCHGPDPAARKAGLRLDLEETAFRKRPGKPDAITPGHPELSEFIKRIESKDPHQLMPQSPDGEAKPMKPEDIAVLKQWIAEGAHYRPHWAFDMPVRSSPPAGDTSASPIDPFIAMKLTKVGLQASPEADRHALIRRVTLDLTGLLPTPREVDAFVQDGTPQAYEHVVDRLLAATAYGEQRTRYWLDYARYADTYGLHFDNNRHIWPYRDYLIKSFNANKPFDQFAKEQIAGDMMPGGDLDALIASAYVRAGVSSNEGGTIPEELKVNIARERTEAYGAAFLGLTVGCAVCHDHKYDPTTQKDFYQLSAFFNNMDELTYNDDMPDWAPVVRIPTQAKLAAYNRVFAERSKLMGELRPSPAEQGRKIHAWLQSKTLLPQAVSSDGLQVRLRMNEGSGEVVHNSAPHAQPASFSFSTASKPLWGETTWLWPDVRFDTATRLDLGQVADFEGNQPFSAGGWFMVRAVPNIRAVKIRGSLLSKMDTTQADRGWDMSTDQGVITVNLVSAATDLDPVTPVKPKPKPGAAVKPGAVVKPVKKKVDVSQTVKLPEKLKPILWPKVKGEAISVSTATRVVGENAWQHIFFTYDGSGRASGVRIYVDGVPVATRVNHDALDGKSIRTSAPTLLEMRSPEAHSARYTRYQDVQIYARALKGDEVQRLPFENYAAEIARTPEERWDIDQRHVISEFFSGHVDKQSIGIRHRIEELTAQLGQLSQGGNLAMVSGEQSGIAYADVLNRGIYTDRKQRVEANTPHFLPPIRAGKPHDRLALAEWTVSPDNPLTARVTVNRMWNEVFGTGLVETTEDFGIMGQRPSNPELLDWLAVEFRESGWDVKHMYKLMVMSRAYRQSARSTPQQVARDPRNLLLSRGPRFRMDGEMLRDIALQSSGLLQTKVGGPSVFPYQPDNVWESVGYPRSDTTHYKQDHGASLYRRSLYTYWKRMAMHPSMDAFDGPTRDTVCTRRQRTDTPLQALVVMNDPQWVEASRVLAERVLREGGPRPGARIQLLSKLVLSRPPSPQMQATLQHSLNELQQHYDSDPAAARALLTVGEQKPSGRYPAPELAAWTMVASEVLNLDEALNK